MRKRRLSLASNHHTLRVPPPAIDREPHPASEPTEVPFAQAIECSFKKHLLKSEPAEQGIEITVKGLRRLRLVLKHFGQTAIVAGVVRGDENALESLTLCRAGLDDQEDEAALVAAAALILESDDRPEFRQTIEKLMEGVRQHPTPVAVHIHFDEKNFDDRAVRIVTHCLAECFFDLFGIEKIHQATDV